jgi:hypothetical protein
MFPKLPFTLAEGGQGDQKLLDFLRDRRNFSYLRRESRAVIKKLPADLGNRGLQSQHDLLLRLWPSVLTDALLTLKKRDSREYDRSNPRLTEFFHQESLGVSELRDVLKAFSEFEGLLYGASPARYRDHIVHSFRVWVVGHGILQGAFGNQLSTYEDRDLAIGHREWPCMWALVALCHDIGYPLSAVEKINALTRETFRKLGLIPGGDLRFAFPQHTLPFYDTVVRLIASKPVRAHSPDGGYVTHLQNKYYLKLLKSFDRLDHGIVSSLLMSKGLVYFLESDLSHDEWKALSKEDCRQFLIRREILRAVAAHTCPDIYHLYFDTLSFLLYMVDEIQCWGRPTFEELQDKPKALGDAKVTVKAFARDRVHIEIGMSGKSWDDDDQNAVRFQVNRLRRMLRLAVDTSKLAAHELYFRVFNAGGQECRLELKGGGIQRHDNFVTKP